MRSLKEPRSKRSWLFSRWFFAIVGIILVLLLVSFVKEIYRSHQVNSEIDDLKQQVIALESENAEFGEFVEYLKTDIYFEEQARLKLGMKQPGEKVIILTQDGQPTPEEELNNKIATAIGAKKDGRVISNREKWWFYFFGERTVE